VRTLTLSKSGYNKIRSLQRELKACDLEDSIKPIPPGEWCLLKFEKSLWVGFVNPLVEEKFAAAHVLEEVSSETEFLAEEFIKKKIQSAINLRKSYQGYEEGCRIFYGVVDGLPGLIVDHFTNATIVQINTAGIDRHRDLISLVLTEALKTKTYFLDNPKYREKEQLPQFSREALPDLVVRENDLTYELRSEVIQKVGSQFSQGRGRESRLCGSGRFLSGYPQGTCDEWVF
jgi:23S rRNA (cytosine1962-C5)-methyltransferase